MLLFFTETFWLNFSEYVDEERSTNGLPSWWTSYEECPLMNVESNLAKVNRNIYIIYKYINLSIRKPSNNNHFMFI